MRRAPESAALLQAVDAALREETAASSLLAGLDPHLLLRQAQRHRVDGLLHGALRGALEEQLPPEVRAALRLAYHGTGLRNRIVLDRLHEILSDLRHRGIAAMPLKGLVLAFTGYRHPEHRSFGDVDLLVREADFPGVREVLEAHGYATEAPRLPAADLPLYAHSVGQIRFACRRAPPLEVHFRLLNLGMPGRVEPCWAEAVEARLGAATVLLPPPERFLLHLCLHAQQHAFALLRLFADIATWCRRHRPQAGRFVELAGEHHLRTAAYLALTFAAELLPVAGGHELPRSELCPPAWRRILGERIWKADQVRALAARQGAQAAQLPRAFLLGESPWMAKMAFLRHVVLPPAAWLTTAGMGESRWRHLRRLLRVAMRELLPREASSAEKG
jgi:hypothetical protein